MKINEKVSEQIRTIKMQLAEVQRRNRVIVDELARHQSLQNSVNSGAIDSLASQISSLRIELKLSPSAELEDILNKTIIELNQLVDPSRLRDFGALRQKKIEGNHAADALKDEIRSLESTALIPTATVDIELIQTWLSEQLFSKHKQRALSRASIDQAITALVYGDDHPADCMNEHWAEFDELLINQEVAS